MTKFTPGPWKYVLGPHLSGMVVKNDYRLGDDFVIASMEFGFEGQSQANLDLMTAAPDLYAALKLVDTWMEATAKQLGITTIHADVRAALARARGE